MTSMYCLYIVDYLTLYMSSMVVARGLQAEEPFAMLSGKLVVSRNQNKERTPTKPAHTPDSYIRYSHTGRASRLGSKSDSD